MMCGYGMAVYDVVATFKGGLLLFEHAMRAADAVGIKSSGPLLLLAFCCRCSCWLQML
jgi:hypothetical protein